MMNDSLFHRDIVGVFGLGPIGLSYNREEGVGRNESIY